MNKFKQPSFTENMIMISHGLPDKIVRKSQIAHDE